MVTITYLANTASNQRASVGRRFKPFPLIVAFNVHVLSILEFDSIIWFGAAKSHIVQLERVQHKFLIWLAANCDSPCASFEYVRLLSHFNVLRVSA